MGGQNQQSDMMTARFFSILDSEDVPQKESLIDTITYGMIASDHSKTVFKDGRDRTPGGKGPSRDKYLSQVCYYALEGNKTGFQEYDSLFKDVRTHILSPQKSDAWFEKMGIEETYTRVDILKEVVQKYNTTHPGKDHSLPTYTRAAQ